MFKKAPNAWMLRLPVLLVIACATLPGAATAQDVTLADAIQCKDFKHNADGSWYAGSVSLNYGPGKKQQMNLSDATIRRGQAKGNAPDLWALLNAKCGAAH
jgi:hypothetical protein